MRIFLIAAIAVLSASQAFAFGDKINNNSNTNYNKSYNDNYNKNYNKNHNNVTNKNYNQDVNVNKVSQGQKQSQAQNNDQTISIEGDTHETAASSAAPVYLTTSNDTCMGSSGLGVQGMQFGFSVGSTWTDSNCIMIKNARELKAHGHAKAAKARLCMDEDNAVAFELAGEPCPRALKTSKKAMELVQSQTKSIEVASADNTSFSIDSLFTSVDADSNSAGAE